MEKQQLRDEFQTLLDGIISSKRVPGVSVAVSWPGERFVVSSGVAVCDTGIPLSEASRFQTGCLTKFLTALVALQAAAVGKLDLDASIVDYLPELAAHPGAHAIRIRHLLTHTSGYQGLNISDPKTAYYYDWDKFTRFFAGTQQLFTPGKIFNYEHSEFLILGEALRSTANIHFPAVFRERFFEPLQLNAGAITEDANNPDFLVADHRYETATKRFIRVKTIPYGELWAPSLSRVTLSLLDLLKIVEPLLSKSPHELFFRRVAQLPHTFGGNHREQLPQFFTLGCAGYTSDLLGHNGSARGQTCALRFDPKKKIAVAVGLNAWLPFLRDTLLDQIFHKLSSQPPKAQQGNGLHHPPMAWDDFSGRYRGTQDTEVTITREKQYLLCTLANLSSKQQFVIRMRQDGRGNLRLASDAQHYSLGFFFDPDTQTPCLMLGMNAYRKLSA